MPGSKEILAGLYSIANSSPSLAAAWHLYFLFVAGALASGVRPSRRLAGLLLTLPLFSVSDLAWLSGNPFNGTAFGLLGIALIAVAVRLSGAKIDIGPNWMVVPGLVLFTFGWLYPHFLETNSLVPYLYAAPTGLVPCPTLSIIIGSTLVVDGLSSRAWCITLGAAGIFYGVFGVLRLGVTIDGLLMLGALVLIGASLANGLRRQATS